MHGMKETRVLGTAAGIVAVAAVACAQPGTFDPPVATGAGNQPNDVVIVNTDTDTDLDLVVGDNMGDVFRVIRNLGGGVFGAPLTITSGIGPRAVAAGDLTGDGFPDIVAVNRFSQHITVFHNNGVGGFALSNTYTVAIDPTAVALGDFDGVNGMDIVVANQGGVGNLSVLLNNGDGTFADDVLYAAGDDPVSVAVADLNNDTFLDIVAANFVGNTVSVLLGVGDGTFGAQTEFPTSLGPRCVVIGELNGDTSPDLAVACFHQDRIQVLHNNGLGSFLGSSVNVAVGDQPRSVAIGDLNNDGINDLASANTNADSVTVAFGTMAGTFVTQGPIALAANADPRGIAIGDLNDDGSNDIVTADYGNGTVSIIYNGPPETTDPPEPFALLSPADDANPVSVTPTLEWEEAVGMDVTYFVCAATDEAFTNVIWGETGYTETSIIVPEGVLNMGARYWWRVEASNAAGTTVSTPTEFTFRTILPGDINEDGRVDGIDLGFLLGNWGEVP